VPASRLAILSPEFSIAAAELWWTLVEQLEREGEAAHIKRRRDGTCAKHRDGSFAHTESGVEEVRSRRLLRPHLALDSSVGSASQPKRWLLRMHGVVLPGLC
jgi:hypothetical protein